MSWCVRRIACRCSGVTRVRHATGTATVISGSNERATVRSTEFAWSGDSAIVTAGRAVLYDATALDVPRNTLIEGCVMRETAVLVKQAGPLYSAISANTTFRRNVAFNTGRACVNVNDGAFGGHTIEGNLLFGCVRETRDHGNINTWARTQTDRTTTHARTYPHLTLGELDPFSSLNRIVSRI